MQIRARSWNRTAGTPKPQPGAGHATRGGARGALLGLAGLACGLLLIPGAVRADGRDISLDFTAASPDSYDHRIGGGAYDDRSIGTDVTESLEGKDFVCGELVTYLTAIQVDAKPRDANQVIELDFRFLANTTGRPGAAFADIANVQVNYGVVEGGDGPGGTDAGMLDDEGSLALLVAESLTAPLFTAKAELHGTVRVDDLEAGEQVILRVDARIVCQPGSEPSGNLHAQLASARVVEPVEDAISGGAQTISVKKVGDLLFPALTIQKTVTRVDGTCPGQEILPIASGDAVKYCYEIANFGTQPLLDLTTLDDNATPDDQSDDFALLLSGLSDEDADGAADDLAPLAVVTTESSRVVNLPVGSVLINRATADGEGVAPVWDLATVRVTDLPAGSCSVSLTASVDGSCPGVEVVNVLEGTEVTWCYQVTNDTAYELLDLVIADDWLGEVGGIAALGAGASDGTQLGSVEFEDRIHVGSASGWDVFGNPRACQPDDAAVNVVRPGINVDKTVHSDGACPGEDSLAVVAGSQVVYCYEIWNNGDTPVVDLELEDDKLGPIGSVASLEVAESALLSSDPVEILDDVTNTATVAGTDEHGFPVSDQDIAIVDALAADLEIHKDGPLSVNREETNQVVYTLIVTNLGDILAEDVTLSDPLPLELLGVTVIPADRCSSDGVEVSCLLGDLGPGESTTVTIQGTVDIPFGRLENEACTATVSPEIRLENNCDQLTTRIAPGDTRSAGFYGNHPDIVQACLDWNGGAIDLGFVLLKDEVLDNEIDSTRGNDLDCELESGQELAMGVLNANTSHYNDGTQRSELEHARMSAGRQVLVAFCNTTLLDTDGGLDFDAIRAILAGTDIDAIQAVQALANEFNLSGDLIPLGVDAGPTDSSFPWDDPTDPYDPDDATEATSPECWADISLDCGLGFELALVLPPLLWMRRRGRRA